MPSRCCTKPHVSIAFSYTATARRLPICTNAESARRQLIEHMRIGYAPGGCLRGWLTQLGHSLPALRQAGLVTGVGYDAYVHRIVFPLEGNLYGRSLSAAAPPHRFLAGRQGRLVLHGSKPDHYPEVILVEGLFDYAVLVGGRLSQRHLLAGNPSQCAPVSATLRRSPNRLSGL